MNSQYGYVLDASAVLALLNQETGSLKVEQALLLPKTVMSVVQLAEVSAKLVQVGISIQDTQKILATLAIPIEPFTEDIAFKSSELMTLAKPLGLSLGDRICLATGIILNLPVLTADKIWLQMPNVMVDLIR